MKKYSIVTSLFAMLLSGKKIAKNTGSQTINEGTFSFDMTASDSWEIGKLYTSEGAILFPYMINGNGYKPTEFDIMLLNGTMG